MCKRVCHPIRAPIYASLAGLEGQVAVKVRIGESSSNGKYKEEIMPQLAQNVRNNVKVSKRDILQFVCSRECYTTTQEADSCDCLIRQ